MVRLDDPDLFLRVSYLVDDIIFDIPLVFTQVIMQQLILFRLIKLRIGKFLIQLFQQKVVALLLIKSKRIKRRNISKVFPVLVEDDILCVKVQILEH